MYCFRFLRKEKPKDTHCVSAIALTVIENDLPQKAYCSLCTGTVSYGMDTISYSPYTVRYGLSGKKGLPALCNVLPPASNVGVLCCTATWTFFSLLSHTLYKYQDRFQWTTSGTKVICHCLQCNQSCHQFVTKHTLVSFITNLGYFVSWGNYIDQTYFPLLDGVISELLTTGPAHIKHIWSERKVIMCQTCDFSTNWRISADWEVPRVISVISANHWENYRVCLTCERFPGSNFASLPFTLISFLHSTFSSGLNLFCFGHHQSVHGVLLWLTETAAKGSNPFVSCKSAV